jgi:hypothetical protein
MAESVFPTTAVRPRARRLRVPAPVAIRLKVIGYTLLALVPAPMYAYIAGRAVTGDRTGTDFLSFWSAGRAVLHGHSPYPLLDSLPAVADRLSFAPFVYPAPAAWGMVPLSILPFAAAKTIFFVLSLGAIALALRLLDVRDWRCFALVLLSVPVVAGTSLGTVSPLLLLGVAAAWRYRDGTVRVAAIVALLVVAKLFLWPLWLWLVYTRRFAAAALAAGLGGTATLGAWLAIGFAGLPEYPRLLSRLTELVGTHSYSPLALLHHVGLSIPLAQQAVLATGAVLAGLAAHRFRADETDERPFVAALGLGLLLTPILWPHYLVLLYLPIALLRRRMSLVWFLPLLMWFDGNGWSDGEPRRIVPFLVLCAVPFLLVLRARRAGGAQAPGPIRRSSSGDGVHADRPVRAHGHGRRLGSPYLLRFPAGAARARRAGAARSARDLGRGDARARLPDHDVAAAEGA